MSDYRLYSCRPDGHFSQRFDFEASDDAAAVTAAGAFLTAVRGELWCGARKICEFDRRHPDAGEARAHGGEPVFTQDALGPAG
jgi:hypothetical protein